MPKRSAVRAALLILASLGLFISYGSVVSAALPSDEADSFPNVIWMDEAQSKILFIAESALNQVPRTNFSELDSLEQALTMRRQPEIYSEMFTGKQIPDCQQTDSARRPQGSADHPKELQDLILSGDRVFAGTIETLVPGWDAWRNNTAVLALIRVEEVLQAQGENDAVKPDARIGVLFKGGTLTIEGVRLCHKIDRNFYHPEIGDRILVTALPCAPCEGITPCVPCESTFLKKRHVFPFVGSEVQPQPYPTLSKEASPASLLDLRLNSQGLVMRQMSGVGNPRSRSLPARTLEGQIIWADEAKEHPVFLPQGVLQGVSVDQLPLDRNVKSFMRNEIKLRKQFGSDCDEPRYSSNQGEAATTYDFAGQLILGSLACTAAADSAIETSQQYEVNRAQIVWADIEKERASFLPQGVTQGAIVDELPLDRLSKLYLQRELEKRKTGEEDCDPPPEAAKQGEADTTMGFVEYIQQMPASFVGTIQHVESGWSAGYRMVAQLATIRVDEVLTERREGTAAPAGSIVTVLFPGGRTNIADSVFCQRLAEGIYRPVIGDRVVVGGRLIAAKGEGYFHRGVVLPVIGDEVLSQPLSRLDKEAVSISLGSLRSNLRPEVKQ